MKTIKTILLFTVIIIFTSISYGEARECNYKSVVQQAICEKMDGVGVASSGKTEKSAKTKKSGKKENNFWKKLKNLGGENVGEPG